jgi:branched-subunit amino acid aminotransferase/4-amino-4-deoxychorismate lyase
LITCSIRAAPANPLAALKSSNKLHQVLARAEAEAKGADEALILDSNGEITECASSNIFWVLDGTLYTPPLGKGILPGVTRGVVLEISGRLGLPWREASARPESIISSDGVFVTLTSLGLVGIGALDEQPLKSSPMFEQLQRAYVQTVLNETR